MQSTFFYAFFFLVITDIMFSAGPYPLSLNPHDKRRNQLRSQVRIFTGHVLEISATHWYTIKIHTRSKYGKETAGACVTAHGNSLIPGQVSIPGSSQYKTGRKANTWLVAAYALRSVGLENLGIHCDIEV